jgi:hypothetical protein
MRIGARCPRPTTYFSIHGNPFIIPGLDRQDLFLFLSMTSLYDVPSSLLPPRNPPLLQPASSFRTPPPLARPLASLEVTSKATHRAKQNAADSFSHTCCYGTTSGVSAGFERPLPLVRPIKKLSVKARRPGKKPSESARKPSAGDEKHSEKAPETRALRRALTRALKNAFCLEEAFSLEAITLAGPRSRPSSPCLTLPLRT